MAVPTNTVQTFDRNSIREDLTDIISNIDPYETPLMSNIGTGSARQRLHEWQVDNLAAASGSNATVEGDDPDNEVLSPTQRRNNYTQLSDKVVQVSSTSRAVDNAGYADELAYQLQKVSKELKRDCETRLSGNFAAVPGNSGTAGESAGSVGFITTNVDAAGDGSDPTLCAGTSGYPNAAAGVGTARAATEQQIKDMMQAAWTAGGTPTIALMGGALKQKVSTFPGLAEQRYQAPTGMTTIIGAADVYVSDFGNLTFVPSRFCPTDTIQLLDPELWKVCDLQPYAMETLAKTGHSDQRMIYREYTLQCQNEAGNAVIRDLDAAL